MKKLETIHLHVLRNDEHFQFIELVLDLTEEVGAAVLKIEPQYRALAAAHKLENEALKKITKSALTEKINEADSARDDIFRGLVDTVHSSLLHFDARVKEAAIRLGIVLDTYGNLSSKSHIEETSGIYNLVDELSSKHFADVEILHLVQWLDELGRRNRAVSDLISSRADEDAARTSLVLKDVRATVSEAYYTLAAVIDAHTLIASGNTEDLATSALYESFVRRLNQRIETMNHTLAQRRGIAAAERAKKKALEEAAKKKQI